jgi:hypothetical protein
MFLHSDAVAENRASGKRTRRIYGENADLAVFGAQTFDHAPHERALAGAGWARDSDGQSMPCSWKYFSKKFNCGRIAILNQRSRARNRTYRSREDVAG